MLKIITLSSLRTRNYKGTRVEKGEHLADIQESSEEMSMQKLGDGQGRMGVGTELDILHEEVGNSRQAPEF